MIKPRVLLVDDDKNTLNGLVKLLTHDGYPVYGVLSGYEALSLFSKKRFNIVITDLKLPGLGGMSLIQEIKKRNIYVAIVVITAYSSVKTAIEAIQCGADEYLTKPIDIKELESVIERLWKRQRLVSQNQLLKEGSKE
ncbi:MAG: response regulator [wastewater metagenome]|nr:response regulator [Candidatus Loosdrechtia aerotolerans]